MRRGAQRSFWQPFVLVLHGSAIFGRNVALNERLQAR
jgi:hypothetical protein